MALVAQAAAPLSSFLAYEQTVNERIVNERVHAPIDDRGNTVAARFRPEARGVWPLDVVVLPAAEIRQYGAAHVELRRLFGFAVARGRAAMFVHPQSRALHRGRIARHGLASSGIHVTPTASYRSLLAWTPGRTPAVLKLTLAATVGRIRRVLHERQIARGVFVSRALDTIPAATRRALRLDWFPERAGVVLSRERHGWLLRHLPAALAGGGAGAQLVPAFSLVSRRGAEVPLLVELIRRSGDRPERFVARELLLPYVNTLAYLLFEEGISFEGHMQNVLYEVDASGALTGGVVLRDLADASVNVALRIARGKPLPPPAGVFPAGAGFGFVANAADFRVNAGRPRILRPSDTVDRYGLGSFVWSLNRSLRRFYPAYSARTVERTYLGLWQRAAIGYLGVRPLARTTRAGVPTGLAVDEAVAYFLEHTDWSRRGAVGNRKLARQAEAVLVARRATRRAGARYARVESAWGDLYLEGTLPAFFRSSF
jgi:hypothetical protein